MRNHSHAYEALDRLTAALYCCTDVRGGVAEGLGGLHSLFAPGARLVDAVRDPGSGVDVHHFAAGFRQWVEQDAICFLQRREVACVSEVFGQVAHRFSTYRTEVDRGAAVQCHYGVKSIQVIRHREQWRITSLLWNDESATCKIPLKYL